MRVTYRDVARLEPLEGLGLDPVAADVLDMDALRTAVRGADVLFHTAGLVGSTPVEKVWELNARAPLIAVEAAALEGVPRVVLTSTISAVGPAVGAPVDERADYPPEGLGLTYADAKHAGEREALAAGARLGVEVVVTNPTYVLGVPVNRDEPGETSTRIVANYLRGRLPAVMDANMNFVDVADVAEGHLLAAERGKPGARYILGGENSSWAELIDLVADASGRHHPLIVLPGEIATLGRLRERLGLPGPISAEAYDLMRRDWRASSSRARDELGYTSRPLATTVEDTVGWYQGLMGSGAFDGADGSALTLAARGLRAADRVGLLAGLVPAQAIVRRRLVAGR